ncbi:UDP-N-acetylglucosamine--N-acetylmuramyl-(pentapeptide) pyrophosphoryl-undecaprenol N-acetylglucosamine transferase [Campylobacter sp. MIT 21-1685]|uniref:UDP-N-acetylglucosamine--N-acetylmuramyl- (pentapeptide) pyrophosphoryl-undecaprenol N-acetylglucosamine transferase n=1 Tax=unclassified Campylobacter TaxID=2593542 RepID=UPI00224B4116|nr:MULTISPECIES: UDP-N-acetylglucosamine--N-acetylmuramyl-(pentapeptide) pyrophosphoryl-undecaprenol N-acetylglucosamine transferase [unclassified Campylobacter]MCX2682319.1 UDP-N-acetylglucosamine--N-acetylmuramyl-(pentapeptide) pyrophosphoryl-undecaprenol N-acetylglucosamine transferase [Campylobacter sp. MIT 21-1684]MCX2750599.1 UDP-N-acetylglucosamine--N-acetylmuramyl-(pentapeptide) pyrophosphoryl-undecaprenol N-acetylglucosamine transferase [Campylobacter sp. MIT 21-1682]MCX2806854.1 UDP-N-
MMIALTGGGTGGHLSIVRSLLLSALKRGLDCIYIGSENGQDRVWFENENNFKAKYFLNSKAVVNQNLLKKMSSFLSIVMLSRQVQKILLKHKIKAVFSVGGYSAAPASFAALMSGIPLFIHEQNSKSGSLNTLLKPFCKGFFSAFEKEYTPYPVSENFFQNARVRRELKRVIFLGGSAGANFINLLALQLAPMLDKQGIGIIHQCGKNDFELCQKTYEELDIEVDLFDFHHQLEEKMVLADLALSRAGASTLFELCANQLPCIFIPYPYAAKNHQFFNAKFLQERNLCCIFLQEQAKCQDVFKAILNFNIQECSENLSQIVQKNGADILLEKTFQFL